MITRCLVNGTNTEISTTGTKGLESLATHNWKERVEEEKEDAAPGASNVSPDQVRTYRNSSDSISEDGRGRETRQGDRFLFFSLKILSAEVTASTSRFLMSLANLFSGRSSFRVNLEHVERISSFVVITSRSEALDLDTQTSV